jgi:trk system potassium uptake protein TrkA
LRLFVVIGLGQFGRHTASTLYDAGGDVIAIDADENRVELMKNDVGQAVCLDATDADALRSVGVGKADTAIVALGEDDLEASIICCSALSDLGVGRIIVRSGSEEHGRILSRVGATRVVYPEKQMGEQLAKSLIVSGVLDHVVLPTGQTVAYIRPRHDFIGKTLRDSLLEERFRLAVIGIQQPKRGIDDRGELHEELILIQIPDLDTVINEDDILIVVGMQNQIELVSRRE